MKILKRLKQTSERNNIYIMNANEKELYRFLGVAEKMSGYDGMDYFEGDLSSFDDFDGEDFDGDYDSYDGMSYASGSAQTQNVSDPYVIQYDNATAGTLIGTLFGFNNYFQDANFNNGLITVLNLQGTSYRTFVGQTSNKPLKIGKWRFQSANSAQLAQTLTITHFDANGKSYSTPLNLSIMRDAYQFQSDILDISKTVVVDANTEITFPVLATTTLVISMFPVAVLSSKAVLSGGQSLNTAVAPRLSGKNVAPVIINTNQSAGRVIKR
jgi:hypothetical protein